MSKNKKQKLQELINSTYKNCWGCGKKPETKHHTPPKALNPRMTIKIPMCKKCHGKLNSGMDYTAREKRSLRSNIRRIEKSAKNIREKVLDKEL